jgi:hypothetical protein
MRRRALCSRMIRRASCGSLCRIHCGQCRRLRGWRFCRRSKRRILCDGPCWIFRRIPCRAGSWILCCRASCWIPCRLVGRFFSRRLCRISCWLLSRIVCWILRRITEQFERTVFLYRFPSKQTVLPRGDPCVPANGSDTSDKGDGENDWLVHECPRELGTRHSREM